MAVLWILLVCAFSIFTPHTESLPFLYNPSAITTFISSASAAAATPDTNSNIQDFTKQAHDPKKLQTDQDLDQSSAPGSSDGNEVVPSIIQKKISKILRKIQFITQFSGSGGNSGAARGGEMSDFDDFFKEDDEEEEQEQGTEANEGNEKKEEVEEFTVIASSTTSTEKPSKYSVAPSSIAVFFMELVGTVMGLFYGAAAQIGNGQNTRGN